ncbi:hypothetical protein PTTG_08578 [Puccinia triticina 1-1 BBBD Race 1]|uniref:Uncharacterized protein n=1 Tax=Puccinia triticina (isolate 1-1 / race 1 (BBBD)) TaxID=630390 RepID=A0A0C4F623_PUCT1|nr:hypothetical protein PTTG_08578 [Puccinia triticina 1-1 BBBD Race 1]
MYLSLILYYVLSKYLYNPAPKRQRGLQMKPNSSKEIATSLDKELIQTKHCEQSSSTNGAEAHPSQNGPSLREQITPASTAVLLPIYPDASPTASNNVMLKMEADRRPKETADQSKTPATVDNLTQMLQSFEQRLKQELAAAPSPPNPSSGSRGPLVCYYCHREGHGTARYFELKKDKNEKLVEQKGTNFFLPNGALILFDSSRPIRHIVASYQPKTNVVEKEFRTTCGTLDPWYPPAVLSQYFSGAYQSDPARKKHEVPSPYKAPAVTSSAAKRPIRKSCSQSPGSKATDMEAKPELFERSPLSQPQDPESGESTPLTPEAKADSSTPRPQTRPAPLDSVNPANRVLNSGNDPKDASHDINQDNMNIDTNLATSCEEPAKDHPKAVKGVLRKIGDLTVLTLTVPELFSIAPAVADGMKKWVSRRCVEVGSGEFKVLSGTLMEESPGSTEESSLYSCPLGFLPCWLGEEEGNAAPLVNSGSQLNLISDTKANKLRLSPRVNFSSAVYGIGNQACELVGVAEDIPMRIGKSIVGTCHFWITRVDGPIILGRPFLMDFDITLDFSGQTGKRILLPDANGRRIKISLCSAETGRWERDFPANRRKAVLTRKGKAQEDPLQGRHFL